MRIRSAPGPFSALVAKDLLVLTGRPGLWLVRAGFVTILFAAIAVAWYLVGEDPADPACLPALGRTIEMVLAVGLILLSGLVVSTAAVGAVKEERASGGLEILLAAPISRSGLLWSHLAASMILGVSFVLAALPLVAVPFFVGGVAPSEIGLFVILPCVLGCAGTAALGVGSASGPTASSVLSLTAALPSAYAAFIVFLVMPPRKLPDAPALSFVVLFGFPVIWGAPQLFGAARDMRRWGFLPPSSLLARTPRDARHPSRRAGDRWGAANPFDFRVIGSDASRRFSRASALFLIGLFLGGALALLMMYRPPHVASGTWLSWLMAGLLFPAPVIVCGIAGARVLPARSEAGLMDALLSSPLGGREIRLWGLAAAAHRVRILAILISAMLLLAGSLSVRPVLPLSGIALLCAACAFAYAVALCMRLLVPRPGPAGALTFAILVVPMIAWFLAAPALPAALRLQSWFTMEPSIEVGMGFAAGAMACVACTLFGLFEACFDRAMGRPAATGAKA